MVSADGEKTVAIFNVSASKITIKDTAKITSNNTNSYSTIFLQAVPESDASDKVVLDIQGGTVENTASPVGYSIYFFRVALDNIADYYTIANGATVGKVYPTIIEPTPAATFTATGADSGTLSGLQAGENYKYSINGGSGWTDFTGEVATISSGVTTSHGVQVVKRGNGTTTSDSVAQTIAITKGAAVSGVFATGCTTASNNDGKLKGVTAAMEYSLKDSNAWSNGTGSDITGLANGVCEGGFIHVCHLLSMLFRKLNFRSKKISINLGNFYAQ